MKLSVRYVLLLVIVLVPSALILSQLMMAPVESEPVIPPIQTDFTIGVLIDYYEKIPDVKIITSYAAEEINRYCNQSGVPYSFKFEVKAAESQAAKALERVQEWGENDVNLIVGPPWSSMFCVCRGYANNNGMLVFSHESTSPLLTVDDNGFRLTITDFNEAQLIVKLLESGSIDSALILQRSDAWANGIADEIERLYDGEVTRLSYPAESTEFLQHIAPAERELSRLGGENKAIVSLSFNELSQIMNSSNASPYLTAVPWFIMGQDVNDTRLNNVSHILAAVNMTGFHPIVPASSEHDALNARYESFAHEPLGYYTANIYDICWLYALSVIETGIDNATQIKQVLPDIASSYHGLTGNCSLDQYGDRNTAIYRVYRYENTSSGVHAVKIGDLTPVFSELPQRKGVY